MKVKRILHFYGSRTSDILKTKTTLDSRETFEKFRASILALVAKTMFNHCRHKFKVSNINVKHI